MILHITIQIICKTHKWRTLENHDSNVRCPPGTTFPAAGNLLTPRCPEPRPRRTYVSQLSRWFPNELCDCGKIQRMSQIVNSCPLTKFESQPVPQYRSAGLKNRSSADPQRNHCVCQCSSIKELLLLLLLLYRYRSAGERFFRSADLYSGFELDRNAPERRSGSFFKPERRSGSFFLKIPNENQIAVVAYTQVCHTNPLHNRSNRSIIAYIRTSHCTDSCKKTRVR